MNHQKLKPKILTSEKKSSHSYFFSQKSSLKNAWSIFQKDLRLELRTREILISMFVFALLTLVLFHFAFEPSSQERSKIIPGLLWICFTFSGVLGLNRTLASEKENSGLESLALCPISPQAILMGKGLTNFIFLTWVELMILPFLSFFFNMPLGSFMGKLLLVNLFGTLGFSITGTLFSSLAVRTRMRDILLPILLFPITIPILIGSIQCTQLVLENQFHLNSTWFKLLIVYDIIFLTVSLMIFEYVLEE